MVTRKLTVPLYLPVSSLEEPIPKKLLSAWVFWSLLLSTQSGQLLGQIGLPFVVVQSPNLKGDLNFSCGAVADIHHTRLANASSGLSLQPAVTLSTWV